LDTTKYGLVVDDSNVFAGGGGGSGVMAPAVNLLGSPYQTISTAGFSNSGACPYKAVVSGPPPATVAWPPGCPGNFSRLAWYILLINRVLQSMGSSNRITTILWDAEDNGPTNTQCSIFEFLYAYDQFRVQTNEQWTEATDMLPLQKPWLFVQNGGPGKTNKDATDTLGNPSCPDWTNYTLANYGKTMGSVAIYQASPEFYWFEGEDMGGVVVDASGGTDAGLSYPNFLQNLQNASFRPCFQSSPDKTGFDKDCACRASVYDKFSSLPDGPAKLLDVLKYVYTNPAYTTDQNTMPAFSLEHLGTAADTLNFNQCINSANSCTWTKESTAGPQMLVSGKKFVDRCGVANFFGNWSESCFVAFLDLFTETYKYKNVMVYDAGFIPQSWLDVYGSEFASVTDPNLDCGDFALPPACGGMDITKPEDLNACLVSLAPVSSPALVAYNTKTCPQPEFPSASPAFLPAS